MLSLALSRSPAVACASSRAAVTLRRIRPHKSISSGMSPVTRNAPVESPFADVTKGLFCESRTEFAVAPAVTVGNKPARAKPINARAWRKCASGTFTFLVGLAHLFFQRIQLRISKDLPPFTAGDSVAGARELPALVLLVGGRHRHRWLEIVRSHHATGAQQRHNSGKAEDKRLHFAA